MDVSGSLPAEAEVRSHGDGLRADADEVAGDELLGRLALELRREGRDEGLGDAGLREELEPPLEGREQIDPVSHRNPRDAART